MNNRILVVAGVAERFLVGQGLFQEMVLIDQDTGEEFAFPLVEGQYARLREFYGIDEDREAQEADTTPPAEADVPEAPVHPVPRVSRPVPRPMPEDSEDEDAEDALDPPQGGELFSSFAGRV